MIFLLIGLLFFSVPQQAQCEVFEYKHKTGDSYRIISTVDEEVYVNGRFSHHSEILNRIAVEVTDVKDGKGRHRAVFQTSERPLSVSPERRARGNLDSYVWAREYESVFDRDKLGYLSIDSKYYMPVVRNVPVFPARELKPKDKWNADGYEMHDFRDSFGIANPYRIPFTAYYEFLGERKWKEKNYPAFSVSYKIITQPKAVPGRIWPRRIAGSSDQVVYWDYSKGMAVAYEEKFSLTFELSNGQVMEFRGTAQAEVYESEYMDKDKLVDEITEELERLNIKDVNVKKVDEGVSLSLDNIMFRADTAEMLPGEHAKLDKIAEILKLYPDRDIVVSGHAARSGTREYLQKLSQDRAKVVSDYLLSQNVRSADRIVVRGFGADQPVADNRTEEGMRKNRRVEITILEK